MDPTYRYMFDPPVNDAVLSFRVHDFSSLEDGGSITAWSDAVVPSGNTIYKNDSSFPYVNLNNSFFEVPQQQTIQPALGFTYMGLIYTKGVGQYPFTWSYLEATHDGFRMYRTDGGNIHAFRCDKSGISNRCDVNDGTLNTWQVYTCRINDNGDSTVSMATYIDNVLQNSITFPYSEISSVVSGYISIGNSTRWTQTPANINISDCFFYDRALSAVEMTDMYTYFTSMGNEYTPLPDYLLVNPGIARIDATVTEVPSAVVYRITIKELPSEPTQVAKTGISTGDVVISNLKPGTSYVLKLFADTGTGYTEVETETVETKANLVENYNKFDYGSNGTYDLSTFTGEGFSILGEVINDLFDTGDKIDINLGTRKSRVSFVRRGETVSTDSSILVPFDSSLGSGQTFTMQLSDTSTLAVTFDEAQNSVSIDGDVAPVGGSVVVDGKKCTVNDL